MTSIFPTLSQQNTNSVATVWLSRITTALNNIGASINNIYRSLGGISIEQPVIQYGSASSTGASGNVVVNLPASYSSINSFVALGVMQDSTAARVSVAINSTSQITIYWSNGGAGAQVLAWSTMGT